MVYEYSPRSSILTFSASLLASLLSCSSIFLLTALSGPCFEWFQHHSISNPILPLFTHKKTLLLWNSLTSGHSTNSTNELSTLGLFCRPQSNSPTVWVPHNHCVSIILLTIMMTVTFFVTPNTIWTTLRTFFYVDVSCAITLACQSHPF